jgi:hypothetical protein
MHLKIIKYMGKSFLNNKKFKCPWINGGDYLSTAVEAGSINYSSPV